MIIAIKENNRMQFLRVRGSLLGLLLCFVSSVTFADYSQNDDVKAFINDMVTKHKFGRAELQSVFSEAQKKDSILEAISRPAEKRLEWSGYRKIFLTSDRIKRGKTFIREHKETLKRAELKYGVPAHIIAAIIGVETRYGRQKGNYRVIDSLSTLAFDYPPRSKFFKSELEHVLLLSKEQGFKPLDLTGSYAGAMGYGQFIPSSYRNFAVDFDGDNIADILNNPIDAIGSVANYFAKHKWRSGEAVSFRLKSGEQGKRFKEVVHSKLKPKHTLADLGKVGVSIPEKFDMTKKAKLQVLQGASGEEYWVTLHNFYVITRYNHSHLYAMAVHQLAEELRQP